MVNNRSLRIFTPAKINLFLQITGKRSDGYHDLSSLMCCISLYDEIIIHVDDRDISVVCDHPDVPQNETNLAHRAATLFLDTLETSQGVEIVLKKHIPVAAGLGGGSSNAAGVLLGLNHHFGQPFANGKPQAGTAVLSHALTGLLFEGLKNEFLFPRGYADAGIFH